MYCQQYLVYCRGPADAPVELRQIYMKRNVERETVRAGISEVVTDRGLPDIMRCNICSWHNDVQK